MLRRIAIEKIYPDLKYGEDYQVLGNKTVIWMNENQQPTESEMQKAYDAEMIERYAKRRSKEMIARFKITGVKDRRNIAKALINNGYKPWLEGRGDSEWVIGVETDDFAPSPKEKKEEER